MEMNTKINMEFEEFIKHATQRDAAYPMSGNGIEGDAADEEISLNDPLDTSMTLFVQFKTPEDDTIHSSINSKEVVDMWDFDELVGGENVFDSEEEYQEAIEGKREEYKEFLQQQLLKLENDHSSELWEILYEQADFF